MTPMQQDQQNNPQPAVAAPAVAAAPQPQTSPRVNGVIFLVLGLAAGAFNAYTLTSSNEFYPKLVLMCGLAVPWGLWTIITGISWEKHGPKPPTWWIVVALALAAAGMGGGFVVINWLEG